MILNVSKIINVPGASMELSFNKKIDFIELGKDKISLIEPVEFVGEISCTDGKELFLTGKLSTVLELPCNRCLVAVTTPISITINQSFTPDRTDNYNEDTNLIEGTEIDLKPVFIKEIILNIPMKTLCNAHCKGLCSVCGQNLNKEICDCNEELLDEHFAILKTLFNGSK